MKRVKQNKGLKGQKGRPSRYEVSFKKQVVREYLHGHDSLRQVAQAHDLEFWQVRSWAEQFSSELSKEPTIPLMTEQEQKDVKALQQQVEALKKKLEYEQMRNFAWETMADLAKTELGIDIRKNFGAKQPKE